jgi:hypothetical protein
MASRVETVAGTVIAISSTQPDTFDQAGYESTDIVFTTIGEITDGGEHGREYNVVEHRPINTRARQVFKGSYTEGTKTMQLAVDNDDAGQVIALAALNSDNDYSFRVVYQGGDKDYFSGKVVSFKKATAGVDSIRSATMTVEITTSSTGVGIVSVTAP